MVAAMFLGSFPKLLYLLRFLVKPLERYGSFPICMKEKPKWLKNSMLLLHFQEVMELWRKVLEMITWSHLGIHKKPVGLLNVDGYYNNLLALFDNGVKEGFINPDARHIVLSASNAVDLLTKMEITLPLSPTLPLLITTVT